MVEPYHRRGRAIHHGVLGPPFPHGAHKLSVSTKSLMRGTNIRPIPSTDPTQIKRKERIIKTDKFKVLQPDHSQRALIRGSIHHSALINPSPRARWPPFVAPPNSSLRAGDANQPSAPLTPRMRVKNAMPASPKWATRSRNE